MRAGIDGLVQRAIESCRGIDQGGRARLQRGPLGVRKTGLALAGAGEPRGNRQLLITQYVDRETARLCDQWIGTGRLVDRHRQPGRIGRQRHHRRSGQAAPDAVGLRGDHADCGGQAPHAEAKTFRRKVLCGFLRGVSIFHHRHACHCR